MMNKVNKKTIKGRDMLRLSEHIKYLRKHPKLVYLFLELTTFCNLHCIHCGSGCGELSHTHMDTEMLFKALETIAQDFDKDTFMICISGGEPMLHPDFKRIVERVVKLGFSWGITSNGTMIDEEMARFLKEQKLGSITVSLDGLERSHDDFRQVAGAFKRTLKGIEWLHGLDIPVQVTSVIHKNNFGELEALYELMCEIKVCSWRVINIEPIGRALENLDLLLNKEQFDELISFIREKRYSLSTPMDVRFGCSHYLSFDAEREVRDGYFICGSGIMVGSILCNGDIFSCLDIERRPELIQGNIRTDRFSEVWHNRFEVFREDRSDKCTECLSCLEKDFCRGDSGHTWDYENNRPLFCAARKEYF